MYIPAPPVSRVEHDVIYRRPIPIVPPILIYHKENSPLLLSHTRPYTRIVSLLNHILLINFVSFMQGSN